MLRLSSHHKVQLCLSIQTTKEAKLRSNQGFGLYEDMDTFYYMLFIIDDCFISK